jgi:hypothetical protein
VGSEQLSKVLLPFFRDYTIHPFPSPAHPSHRLLIALRLIAVDVRRPGAGQHASSANKEQVQQGGNNLKAWEDMVMGQSDIVCRENEVAVIDILRCMCEEIQTANSEKEQAMRNSLLNHNHLDPSVSSRHHVDVNASKGFIEKLLQEENFIAQLLKDGIKDGLTDW